MTASVLLVFNGNHYDGTDVTWNSFRLAEQLLNLGMRVCFLGVIIIELAQWVTDTDKVISF